MPAVATLKTERRHIPDGIRLNLGCGPVHPEGWINIDGSHRAWLSTQLQWLDRLLVRAGLLSPSAFDDHVLYHNLLRPFPFTTDSVAGIYAGELWEHFTYPDAVRVTAECFRVLKPGGVLRVCVPDGQIFWRHYLRLIDQGDVAALRAHVALFFGEICTAPTLGSYGHFHKWQYDEPQLVDLFRQVGFINVQRMPYHDSRIPAIASVERSAFLIVEGIAP